MKFNTVLKLTSAILAASAVEAADSLKSKAGNFRIGVAANSMRFSNSAYVSAMSNFNYMVAENSCKMAGIQPQQGNYNFKGCDEHYNKAKELGMAFRGHCLIWHSMPPQWFQNLKGDALKTAIVEHINKTLKYYEGKIDTWDVVNEAIDDSSNGPQWKMRDSFLYQNVPDFVDLSFKTAREASPTTKLFYNDYNTEGIWGKSEAVFNFVKDMKTRGIPIDGVGLQYHVSTEHYPEYSKINKLIGDYCNLGLQVHITEMDVKGGSNSQKQATIYAEALKACLSNSCCKAFLVWGVGDNDSWLGANEKGLLFDSNYQPKAAYTSLVQTLGSGAAASSAQQPAEQTAQQPTQQQPAEQTAQQPAQQPAEQNNNNQWNQWGGNNDQQQNNNQWNQWGGNNNQWNQWGGNNNQWGGNNNQWGGNNNQWGGNNNQWGGNNAQNAAAPNDGGNTGGNGNCASMYGQCGGQGYTGPTCCKEGTCKAFNEYYSQCV